MDLKYIPISFTKDKVNFKCLRLCFFSPQNIQEQANHFVLFTVLKLTDFCGSGVLVMLLLALMNDMGKCMFPSHLYCIFIGENGKFFKGGGFIILLGAGGEYKKLIRPLSWSPPKCPFMSTQPPPLECIWDVHTYMYCAWLDFKSRLIPNVPFFSLSATDGR